MAAYLGFMARLRRLPDAAAGPWIERFGLTSLLDVRLPELSKGSAQKVGLVQAMSAGPGLLVLDEPFAGLDAQTRSMLPGVLTELAESGTTIVVSDHQGCLDDLSGVDRHRVENHSITMSRPGERVAGDVASEVILEVGVAPDEAEAVAAKLRADGHRVRWVPR